MELSYKFDSLYDVAIASRFKGDCYRNLRKWSDSIESYIFSLNTIRQRFNINNNFDINNDGK